MFVLIVRYRIDLVLLRVTILGKSAAQRFPITSNAFSQKLATLTNAKLFKYFPVGLRRRQLRYPRQVQARVQVRHRLPAPSRLRRNVPAAYQEIPVPIQIRRRPRVATLARILMVAHSVTRSAAHAAFPLPVHSRLRRPLHAAKMRLLYSADLLFVSGQTASRLFLIQVQRQHHSMHRRALTIIGYGMCPMMAA
jgi:hypothetical protein